MRAVRWHARGDVRVEEVPPPPPPGTGEVQLRVSWCGICGTDLEEWQDGPLFIPVGEAVMFLAILPIAARTLSDDDRPITAAVTGGAMFSVAIFGGYALAYLLLEYGRTP